MTTTIETLNEQHRITQAIITKLAADRESNIKKLAGLKTGYKDLLISVYDGSKPQSELDTCRAELQNLQWIIENEPVSDAADDLGKLAKRVAGEIEALAYQQRAIDTELHFRKRFNLMLSEKEFNNQDWQTIEYEAKMYHQPDLDSFINLRAEFDRQPVPVRAKGFLAYAGTHGLHPFDEQVTMANISSPRG